MTYLFILFLTLIPTTGYINWLVTVSRRLLEKKHKYFKHNTRINGIYEQNFILLTSTWTKWTRWRNYVFSSRSIQDEFDAGPQSAGQRGRLFVHDDGVTIINARLYKHYWYAAETRYPSWPIPNPWLYWTRKSLMAVSINFVFFKYIIFNISAIVYNIQNRDQLLFQQKISYLNIQDV